MSDNNTLLLGVNIDHVATVRQARGTDYPDPSAAVELVKQAGADGLTIHLREDRRHIIDRDVVQICRERLLPVNLEMAATEEMLAIALQNKPEEVCLVPEKREELTTEGGLDVAAQIDALKPYTKRLQDGGIRVSLFIDPEQQQISAAHEIGADIVELHTGVYCECDGDQKDAELSRIAEAARYADSLGLVVNAGHGLHYQNVKPIAAIDAFYCLNIGHAIIAKAVFVGLQQAVTDMLRLMSEARA